MLWLKVLQLGKKMEHLKELLTASLLACLKAASKEL